MNAQGGCYCGAVRYEVSAAMTHTTLCHCADCRRISGAPAVAWFTVPQDRLTFSGTPPHRFRSSEHVMRAFCAECGTPLTYEHDQEPGYVDVITCSLDEPALAAPKDHTFYASRVPWMHACDGLPRFPRTRSEGHVIEGVEAVIPACGG